MNKSTHPVDRVVEAIPYVGIPLGALAVIFSLLMAIGVVHFG